MTGLVRGDSANAADKVLEQVREQFSGDPKLLMVFASTEQPLDDLMPRLSNQLGESTVLGASTAGEFTEKGDAKGATSFIALDGDFVVKAGMGRDLGSNVESAVGTAINGYGDLEVEGYDHRTSILLLDPLVGTGEEAVLTAAMLLGDRARLAGGAAGDDLQMKATHVALGGEVASDAVVTAMLYSKNPLGVGVCHAHEPLSEAVEVTAADGALISEINGRPAWEVWQELAGPRASQQGFDVSNLSVEDEGAFLLSYEAGLPVGSNYKIRAPLARTENGAIQFACSIPQGAKIQITESCPDRQQQSAVEAARRAREQAGTNNLAAAIVFDCICRNLILKDRFGDAMSAVSGELGGVPLAGFETYGEIALDAGELSGFHNTTTVVLAVPED